jgi:hypothetical protein
LFSNEVLGEKSFLLIRSLLSQGDCFVQDGRNMVFYSNVSGTLRNRNENWRRFFKSKLHFIKKIINHSLFNKQDVLNGLNGIIDLETQTLQQEYLIKLINNPKLFEYARQRCIRKINKGYYILGSTMISGYYVELFTYDWHLYNNKKEEYIHAKTEVETPRLKIKRDKTHLYINLNNKTAEFDLADENHILIDSFSNIDEAYKKIVTNA